MKFIIYTITILSFISCIESYDEEKERKDKVFYESISIEQKRIIDQFFNNQLEKTDDIININNGYCILWKRGNYEIYPDHFKNEEFLKKGYNITFDKTKLKYFLVAEREVRKEGTYTNGGAAVRLGTNLYIIDIDKKKFSLISSEQGGDAPSTITERRSSSSGGHGSYMSDGEIMTTFENLINNPK